MWGEAGRRWWRRGGWGRGGPLSPEAEGQERGSSALVESLEMTTKRRENESQ